jgi:hypothetical protein
MINFDLFFFFFVYKPFSFFKNIFLMPKNKLDEIDPNH